MMLLEVSEQQAIYGKALSTLESKLKSFKYEIITTFNQTFTELSSFYKKKQSNQSNLISNMKKFIENFESKCQNDAISISPKQENVQEHEEQEIQLADSIDYTEQKVKEEGSDELSDVQELENIHQSNDYSEVQEEEEQRQPEKIQVRERPIPEESKEFPILSLSLVNQKKKYPLQTSKRHRIINYSMTPNITTITYKLLEYDKSPRFNQQEVETLKKYDLSGIQSIDLNDQNLTDSFLSQLTLLPWKNIKSLGLGFNLLTDIRPLKNFNLGQFLDLDISLNNLNIKSAQFLASTSFNSLLYFAVSFAPTANEECWQVILKNKMQNFPKLQNIEIRESQQLSDETKNHIKNVISGLQQRQKIEEKHKYPSDYHIKLNFEHSKEFYSRFSIQQRAKAYNKWKKDLKVSRKTLKPISVNKYIQNHKHNAKISSHKIQSRGTTIKDVFSNKKKIITKKSNNFQLCALKKAAKSAKRS